MRKTAAKMVQGKVSLSLATAKLRAANNLLESQLAPESLRTVTLRRGLAGAQAAAKRVVARLAR
jgi:hypothetical protein